MSKHIEKKTPPDAEARLEELDVREVSVVDRPANRRKWLIVKRNGKVETMSSNTIGLADLMSLNSAGSEVEKSLQAEVLKATTSILEQLSKLASASKEMTTKDAPSEVLQELLQIAESVDALSEELAKVASAEESGESNEQAPASDTEKGTLGSAVVKATEMMMQLVNKVKELSADADKIPAPVLQSMKKIAALIRKAVGSAEQDQADQAQQEAAPAQQEAAPAQADSSPESSEKKKSKWYVEGESSDDPLIVMELLDGTTKKARLSDLETSAANLMAIIEKVKASQKSGGSPAPGAEDIAKALEPQFKSIQDRNSSLTKDLQAKIEALQKNVDSLMGANPGGSGDEEPPATSDQCQPVEKRLWSGLFPW